jgi:integrase
MKYRSPAGGERKLSFGAYPDVSLKVARGRRDEARRLLADGIDPADHKRHQERSAKIRAENSFLVVSEAYIAKNEREKLAPATIRKRRWHLALVKKKLGHLPIAEIQPIDVLEAVRPFETARNDEKAHRTLEFIGQVFRFAVASQLAPSDPTRDLRGALTRRRPRPMAAIIDPKRVGALMRAIDGYDGHPVSKIALQISPHVFLRPGELRAAEWCEIDFDAAVWRIPAARMKGRVEHIVPLSKQVLELFRAVQDFSGHRRFVFPSIGSRDRCMSENTINTALRRMGYTGEEMTAHGFRAMASTLLNESGKFHPDAIERALAHRDRDAIRGVYNRGQFWSERIEMAQWWSDHLDQLRSTSAGLHVFSADERGCKRTA